VPTDKAAIRMLSSNPPTNARIQGTGIHQRGKEHKHGKYADGPFNHDTGSFLWVTRASARPLRVQDWANTLAGPEAGTHKTTSPHTDRDIPKKRSRPASFKPPLYR